MKLNKVLPRLIFLIVISIALFLFYQTRVTARQEQTKLITEFEESLNLKNNLEIKGTKNKSFSVKKSLMGTIGVLYAPDIDLQIAVFNNSGQTAISEGAGLIPGTGNLNPEDRENSIITSHNGDTFKDLFMNVPRLKVGQNFYLKLKNNKIYKYEIINTQEPHANEEDKYFLTPNENENYVTLRTCTPIGVNTHRFLATGKLIEEVETIDTEPVFTLSLYEIGLLSISGIATILLLTTFKKDRRKHGNRTTN